MKFLRLFATVLAVCAFACPALAQKTKTTLQSEINANFPDQITGFITPADARTSFSDFLASWQQATQVNAQINTSYTIQTSDYGNLVTFNNAGTVSVSIPQAIAPFATFNVYLKDLGAGSAIITPQGGLINGAGSLTLAQGQQAWLVSDGTNWQAWSGVGSNIACSSLPALTGDVASPAGSCATTIQPGVVTGADIAAGTITSSNIASGTITSANIASGTITSSNIASNTIANSNLTQAGANTLKGNPTGSTANETDTSVPSCSSANQALQWTSGTGFSCANISTSGGMTLLNTLTASNSASLSDTTSLTSTYATYMVVFNSVLNAGTVTVQLEILVSTNGGSTYLTTGYQNIGGATTFIQVTAADQVNTAGYGVNAVIYIHNPSAGTHRTSFDGVGAYTSTTSTPAPTNITMAGYQDSNTAINAIQFKESSGNITSGVIKIYGIP